MKARSCKRKRVLFLENDESLLDFLLNDEDFDVDEEITEKTRKKRKQHVVTPPSASSSTTSPSPGPSKRPRPSRRRLKAKKTESAK